MYGPDIFSSKHLHDIHPDRDVAATFLRKDSGYAVLTSRVTQKCITSVRDFQNKSFLKLENKSVIIHIHVARFQTICLDIIIYMEYHMARLNKAQISTLQKMVNISM